ncbi:hypothetical protein I3843_01G053300 [Carya illinoinensis]|uniref:Cyclic nucleotide-binding domain-containing protein n=2 Tax=Carya illinoinensis TaxID=32201 RepID=A0A922G017_CARIL|nr:cyclic nucleotide-gated ion channel 1-like [Carya illinoinensis]XP_042979116.1 cyclic nucleotide-gated ion channel 1-like [Carya illinoinensis]KAG6729901.1 hypothetical protein I3842_01G054300 [Carya illinoinensis]KAG6729902.1 hypothetical protein I3842_01G054300 [Carya illinoinensis]KAG6729903.1 hypothetical protein I3842_01G054300 [Carya illinoinensis]KAG7994330.1 hypothetical protein I3843_01G053300 [Carya illinoinensis]KAG7994331.1 hypothetical protein I3843_01G053300 [Carya illinoinen
MDSRRNNFVRFRSWSSENSMNDGIYDREPRNDDQSGPRKMRVHDPQDQFLQRWNKLFVLSCAISLALDPLFFYIPVLKLNDEETCLYTDRKLAIIICVLRSVTDAFYAIHIYLQFRTGIIIPSSRVFGKGQLISHPMTIAKRYLFTYFTVDVLAILPLPQVVVFVTSPSFKNALPMAMKEMLKSVIFSQYVPRLLRIYPLYVEVIRHSGRLTKTAWGGAASNFFVYMLASHVIGAFWYFFGIERQDACWQKMCRKINGCRDKDFYCGNKLDQADFVGVVSQACRIVEPDETKSSIDHFDYGIFTGVLKSGVVESRNFSMKFSYCFWWGFRSLSSIGQNLETSTFFWEIVFVVCIAISGLVFLLVLIGNMQIYLQSTTVRRVQELRVRKTDIEQWMSRCMLPNELRERVRQHEQHKWLQIRGVEEENLIRSLPKDLRRDIKRHLCLNLLLRVPAFNEIDQQLWDPMLDRLKTGLYTKNTYLIREGDPVDEMIFIMRGTLTTSTANGGTTDFFNTSDLKSGDFCGEELLDLLSSTALPISTRTLVARTEVEAFILKAEDLRIMASQFPKLRSWESQHAFRFYSHQWRTWAACFIQSAWRRFCKRKHERAALCDAENRLQYALANEAGTSESLGATKERVKDIGNTRVLQLLPSKLVEPNFNVAGDNTAQERTTAVVTEPATTQTSMGHPPNVANIVRTEIFAALEEHRVGMERIIMLIMTRLTDMEGHMAAIEEVLRTRSL